MARYFLLAFNSPTYGHENACDDTDTSVRAADLPGIDGAISTHRFVIERQDRIDKAG